MNCWKNHRLRGTGHLPLSLALLLSSGCACLQPASPEEPIVDVQIERVPTPVRLQIPREALRPEYVPPLPAGRHVLNSDLATWIEQAVPALQLMQGRLERLQDLLDGHGETEDQAQDG